MPGANCSLRRARLSLARARCDRARDAACEPRASGIASPASNSVRRRARRAAPVPAPDPGSGRARPRGSPRLRARRRMAHRPTARAAAPHAEPRRRALRALPERPLDLRPAARGRRVVPRRLALARARRPRAQRRPALHRRGGPAPPHEEADPRSRRRAATSSRLAAAVPPLRVTADEEDGRGALGAHAPVAARSRTPSRRAPGRPLRPRARADVRRHGHVPACPARWSC